MAKLTNLNSQQLQHIQKQRSNSATQQNSNTGKVTATQGQMANSISSVRQTDQVHKYDRFTVNIHRLSHVVADFVKSALKGDIGFELPGFSTFFTIKEASELSSTCKALVPVLQQKRGEIIDKMQGAGASDNDIIKTEHYLDGLTDTLDHIDNVPPGVLDDIAAYVRILQNTAMAKSGINLINTGYINPGTAFFH